MVDKDLKLEHAELVNGVPFEAKVFLYFSIENNFGEDLTKLHENLKVWNFEHPDAKAYYTKALEREDKTYFAVTIEFDYPTYLNQEVVSGLIDKTNENFTEFFHKKIEEI